MKHFIILFYSENKCGIFWYCFVFNTDIPTPGYGTCSTYFQRLCRWRDSCAPTEQMDKLYKVCLQAEMGETVEKLKGIPDYKMYVKLDKRTTLIHLSAYHMIRLIYLVDSIISS